MGRRTSWMFSIGLVLIGAWAISIPALAEQEGSLEERLKAIEEKLTVLEEENESLRQSNKELQERLRVIEGRPEPQGEEQQSVKAPGALEKKEPSLGEKAGAPSPIVERLKEWVERVRFFGDMRLRYEGIFQKDLPADRHRHRVRLRLGATVKISDQLEAGIRVATGDPDDPTTTNQTFTDFFSRKPLDLDRFYLTYRPFKALTLTGGKFQNPFKSTEMIWDEDVQPEGLAETLTFREVGPLKTVTLVGGQFVLSEVAAATDSAMFGWQVILEATPSKDLTLALAGAYYDFEKTDRIARALATGDLKSGNTNRTTGTGAETRFLSDFRIVNVLGQVDYKLGTVPLRLIASYAHNTGASDKNDGYWLEAYVGGLRKKGEFRVGYGFALVETDAALSAFNSDDWLDTNIRTHMADLAYQLFDNTTLKLEGFFIEENDLEDPGIGRGLRTRVRLNVIVRF